MADVFVSDRKEDRILAAGGAELLPVPGGGSCRQLPATGIPG